MILSDKKEFKEFLKAMKLNKKDIVEIKVPRSKKGALMASKIQEQLTEIDYVIGFKDE